MASLSTNTLANFAGRGLTAVLGLVFVPLYVRFLGIESYGLVGFYATLQSLFGLINAGFGATLTRELARLSGLPDTTSDQRNLVRTLEIVFWISSTVVAVVVVLLAPVITNHWVNRNELSGQTVTTAVELMGLAMATEFVTSFYQGGLAGLQHQVSLNVLRFVSALVRNVGVFAILIWVSATIPAFFAWSFFIGLLQALASGWLLWRRLPRDRVPAAFCKDSLLSVWKYTIGMIGINVTVLLLMQTDKIVLSRLFSLDTLGYYTLAGTVAAGITLLIQPLFMAIFPRFSQLVAAGSLHELVRLYHVTCQLASVMVFPLAAVLGVFAEVIVRDWTGSTQVAARTAILVTLIATGNAFNSIVNIPYALQLANGWTKLTLYQNGAAIVLCVPATIFLARHFGAPGAALVWVFLNLGNVLIQILITHPRLMPGEGGRWVLRDVLLPLFGALSVGYLGKVMFPASSSVFWQVTCLVGIWGCATLTSLLVAPDAFRQISEYTSRWKRRIVPNVSPPI